MALIPDFLSILKSLERRVEILERTNQLIKITIPTGGKLVVNKETSDPPVNNGQIYYNTTSNKFRKCAGGVWSDV